jgi:aspartyl-tRNA(Asn)/glutamyl-tRNA(Gln) amidotransferase subunit A
MTGGGPSAARSAREIARLCASGQTTSRSIVRQCLDAIAAENGKLHAFVEIFAEGAMRRAEELDTQLVRSGSAGPLHGVPIAVKDLADIGGRSPGFGSKCYAAKREAPTAPAIQRLIDAGAVVVGMTHMVEFALGGWGTNHAMGTPWNPVDRDVHRVPGGSSSGSAVAVAAGLVPAAVGSDTGGSLRIPGSLCGIVGFKPSFGVIPLDGIAPLGPSFDTLGPLARDIADARLLFSVMAGVPVAAPAPVRSLRVGVPHSAQLEPCDPDILRNFERSVEALRAMGHDIVLMSFPKALTEYQALCGGMVSYDAYRQHKSIVEDAATPLDPHVRQRVLAGRDIGERRYAELIGQRRVDIAAFKAEFGHLDIVVLPSTPLPAIPVADVDETTLPMSRYTRAANWLDLCALSLPNGFTSSGLPTGLQAMSWPGADAKLLDCAERAAS